MFVSGAARWEYLRMVLAVTNTMGHMGRWVERCPCHSPPLELGSRKARRRSGLGAGGLSDVAAAKCPMKGRRAPEMAAGALTTTLRQFWAEGCARIMMGVVALAPEDRDRIMSDMQKAREFILAASEARRIGTPRRESCTTVWGGMRPAIRQPTSGRR